jgi:hypothetical protein
MYSPQPLLFENDAKSEFSGLEGEVRRCVELAEKEWNKALKASPRMQKAARGRGRNSIFNEIVADFARERLSGIAEVDICEQFGTVRLHVKGLYDLGFKKVDHNGRTSNYLTPRRKCFDAQQSLLPWGDPLPDAIRLHIGISWNVAATEIADVFIVYPYKRWALWHYSIGKGGWSEGSAPIRLPVTAPKLAAPARFRSTLVKDDRAKKGKRKA